jgi:hypothetical protein
MRRLVQVSLGLTASLFVAVVTRADAPCVGVSSRAVYRNYGYDHIVYLTSRCDRAATCDVSTDVNPTAEHVTVPPKERIEVLTFRGSPASAFTPHVTCRPSS